MEKGEQEAEANRAAKGREGKIHFIEELR